MALSADKDRKKRGTEQGVQRIAIKTGSTVYIGGLIAQDSTTSRGVAGSATTNRRTAGIAYKFDADDIEPTGVGNTAGTQYVWVEYGAEYLFTLRTAIRTDAALGRNVFISDDDVVGGTAVGTSAVRVPVGECVGIASSTQGWIAVRRFCATNITI